MNLTDWTRWYSTKADGFRFISLFSGIGGFDLGFEQAGMRCIGQVEIDPYCRAVLKHHWPYVKRVKDIHDVNKETFDSPDLICGGFPCQPFSAAGKRRGMQDDRYLWPEMLRVIKTYRPAWVVGENVAGITSMVQYEVFSEMEDKEFNSKEEAEACFKGISEREGRGVLDMVLGDLEKIGYEVQTLIIPACGVDAPHRRDRVWIVAHRINQRSQRHAGNGTNGIRQVGKDQEQNRSITENGLCGGKENVPDPTILRRGQRDQNAGGLRQGAGASWQRSGSSDALRRESQSRLGRVVDGISRWLDEPAGIPRVTTEKKNRVNRLRALGNTVVPRIPEIIGRYILEIETANQKEARHAN